MIAKIRCDYASELGNPQEPDIDIDAQNTRRHANVSRLHEGNAMPRGNIYSAQCPTRHLLGRLGDKWALMILHALSSGPMRFSHLKRHMDGVSQRMLSRTLKDLERDGLVHREAIATVPVTVYYSATELGASLFSSIDALHNWAENHIDDVANAQKDYDHRMTDSEKP